MHLCALLRWQLLLMNKHAWTQPILHCQLVFAGTRHHTGMATGNAAGTGGIRKVSYELETLSPTEPLIQ